MTQKGNNKIVRLGSSLPEANVLVALIGLGIIILVGIVLMGNISAAIGSALNPAVKSQNPVIVQSQTAEPITTYKDVTEN